MMEPTNGFRRPIQFWVAIISIGGLVLTAFFLLAATAGLALYGDASSNESDTLNNALLLTIGGLVGLSGSVGAYLFSRGAQGEPIPPPQMAPTPAPGQTVTVTTQAEPVTPVS